jgi:hypothetical protein
MYIRTFLVAFLFSFFLLSSLILIKRVLTDSEIDVDIILLWLLNSRAQAKSFVRLKISLIRDAWNRSYDR